MGTFASGWERLSVCFPFEYGEATSVLVELVCDAKSGTLNWACPQLERGRLAGPFNMVSDGDFSLTKNNTAGSTPRLFPKQWTYSGNGVSTSTLNCIVTDRAVNGLPDSVSGNAMRLTCKPSVANVYIVQDVVAYGSKEDVFTISGWCNAQSVASAPSTFQPRLGGNRSINPRYRKVVVLSTHTAENHNFISSDQGSRSSISKSLFCFARSGSMLNR